MENRPGDWFQTFGGKKFWIFDPKVEEVDIKDIAHSLALQCRYNGHCNNFYSVAQHSVIVSKLVSKEQALAALLHDATESYMGDMISPFKKFMPQFKEIELNLEKVIFEKFGIRNVNHHEIKEADNTALVTEMRDLMKEPSEFRESIIFTPLPERIIPLGPDEAERMFLERFNELTNQEQ